ncbi:DUF1707 domain-containing protein [Gordonia rubripertincta]|uniref:DUF1707 domain-containing protein n=2 Tax=Gordonia rubripertincta TaxID=36822 RepID=A0AAW6R311_GORRU|nr:DUF1707 domain-containing protein [Gordonia rubripertincta]MDG6779264.1 DUF1707 domain-containing protein [Gordonia rubripertincta]NKY62575.1 DUF1707 domain-containing protein [Gordonia rubripertincta]GAB85730.1 hypothetical protein GORBP_065_00590 [Gordonia rubripertincta NBRC 101908]
MVDRLSDDDLRVGNPERERAIALLNDAFASGYLEIVEFEDRSGLVYTAKTRRELRTMLEDLPSAAKLFPEPPAAAPAGPAAEPLHLDADWSEVRRKGVWEVPSSILATASVGTVDLDFTAARFTGPSTSVQLQVSASTVKLKLGPEHEVRHRDLHLSGWSKVKDKAGAPTRPGGAVIELIGSASGMTSVIIRRT